jgi:hypothetical protein
MSDDRPIDAGAPEIEITPAMENADIDAFSENASEDCEHPSGPELRAMMRAIFLAMFSRLHKTEASTHPSAFRTNR